MTWTGRTVDLPELLYAFLREHDQLSVESVLDWSALRARLEGLPESTSAVALDAWMREPIDNRELIKMGGASITTNTSPRAFAQRSMRPPAPSGAPVSVC